jgi:hypothetical protein
LELGSSIARQGPQAKQSKQKKKTWSLTFYLHTIFHLLHQNVAINKINQVAALSPNNIAQYM